ncbi:MAG: HAD family hydrolase [Dehalococcoidia bacterium]
MQAVLFDLWETLIHDAPELQRARQLWRAANIRAIFDLDGENVDTGFLDQALTNAIHGLSAMHDRGTDTDAAGRVQLFLGEYEKLGGPAPDERTHETLHDALCTMPAGLYPQRMAGAVETLSAIKAQGLKTALISNAGITTAPTLREMLEHYGLLPLLDVLVFSDEMQLAKPSVAIFETALSALGCDAPEAVFIGDSPAHDVAGARAAGMRTVVIGHKHIDGIEPDARIEDLGALLDVLDVLESFEQQASGFEPRASRA